MIYSITAHLIVSYLVLNLVEFFKTPRLFSENFGEHLREKATRKRRFFEENFNKFEKASQ